MSWILAPEKLKASVVDLWRGSCWALLRLESPKIKVSVVGFEGHWFVIFFPTASGKVLDRCVVLEVSWEEGGCAGLSFGRGERGLGRSSS